MQKLKESLSPTIGQKENKFTNKPLKPIFMPLNNYRAKRNFAKTKEPRGKSKVAKINAANFVIQKHQARRLHFDFRLEAGGVLKSWAVPKGLPKVGEKRLAMMVEDHPIEYQNFEGTIPEGNYGAGTVMIWDKGKYALINKKDVGDGLEKGEFSFVLVGEKLEGEYSLIKLKKGEENSWLMICRSGGIKKNVEENVSAVSRKTMEQITFGTQLEKTNLKNVEGSVKKEMPTFVVPMLSTLVDKSFDDDRWLFEIKWDGYRVIAIKKNKDVQLFSRNRKIFNEIFFPIAESLKKISGDFILDGEVVAVDEKGKSSFQMLQNYLTTQQGMLLYYVFDILYLDNYALQNAELIERKKILQKFLPKMNNVKISEYILGKGKKLYENISKLGNEGVVGKKLNSKYLPAARSDDWVKIKVVQRQEAVVAGFTEPRGGRKKFGALILAVYEKGKLKYIGHTGGGFDDKMLEIMQKKLEPLIISKCPLEEIPETNAPATWVKPQVVVEIKFSQWTEEGIARQPIFLGLREDKNAEDAIRELPMKNISVPQKRIYKVEREGKVQKTIGGKKLALTNLEKVFWPKEGYTKGDLIEYYAKISRYILPYLKDRLQSLNRFPNGIEKKNFFQKDMEDLPPWIEAIKIRSDSENRAVNYMLCQKQADLIYMINLGCIEINPWNSRVQNLDNPDYMVFDIDPLDAPFLWAVQVAIETKKVLDEIGISSFCKTSGSRGLHVYVPLAAKYDYETVKEFCRLVNIVINARLPKITSLERKPQKRMNKIYLDYLQNRIGQTMAAPYSVRPKAGAPVSAPLEWEEVNEKLDPLDFNILTMEKRLKEKGDLWKKVLGKGADLEKSLKLIAKMMEEERIK